MTWERALGSGALVGSGKGVSARVQHMGYPERFVLIIFFGARVALYQSRLTNELDALKMANTFLAKNASNA